MRLEAANGRARALEPIAGVTLEQYAELRAHMAHLGDDVEAFAAAAERHGVDRYAWAVAASGWAMRMEDPATAHIVAPAFRSLYRSALNRLRARVESIEQESPDDSEDSR